ncbi:MAG: carbon monoxide dehydrogenase subunit G [Pseudolabrys sp.]
MPAPPSAVWRSLLDPESLKAVIPGCHELQRLGDNDYRALVSLGVGPVRGKFEATVKLSDLVTEKSGRIAGTLIGPLGGASGAGNMRLEKIGSGTRIDYDYVVTATGKVVSVGGRLLDGATAIIIRQFFERLAWQLNPETAGAPARTSAGQRLLKFLGLGGGGA